jgi:hypothetical protein
MTTEEVAAALTEALPAGITADRAVAVLDSLGFHHEALSERDSTLRAILRDIRKDGFITTSVRVTLFFDKNHNLTKHEVEEILTGP